MLREIKPVSTSVMANSGILVKNDILETNTQTKKPTKPKLAIGSALLPHLG